jgi:hypothetical protein
LILRFPIPDQRINDTDILSIITKSQKHLSFIDHVLFTVDIKDINNSSIAFTMAALLAMALSTVAAT